MKLKRNRIVIDLDQARADEQGRVRARRSGRAGRVLGFIGVGLVVIIIGLAAGGYFWWRHYQTQPAYSLALLIDAAQRNDRPGIDRLLDMDKITDNFVSQVRQRTAGSYSSVIGSLMPSQIEQAAAAGMTPKLKQTIHDELPGEIQRSSAPAGGKPFAVIALALPYFVNVKQQGNSARAETKIKDEQIQLTMQQDATGRWQIVAVEDDRLAGIVAESIKKDLSQSGTQLQDEVQQHLKRPKSSATSR
jgi:hypothetical protein